MEKLVSLWSNGKKVPENYVFPPAKRPGNEHLTPTSITLPLIDLGKLAQGGDNTTIVQQIMDAAQQFGLFQVINHGVPRGLMDDVMDVFKEFFELPAEEKVSFCNGDFNDKCVLFTSNVEYHNEELHFWRDALKHSSTPLDECIQSWPQNPPRYREVVGEYTVNMRELGSKILELICQGLGLEKGYFDKELSQEPILIYSRYPPCPNPSLTFGISEHFDPNLISLLLQNDVPGLQVYKDGEWVGVEPIPGAFLVNVADQLQIVSNGKLRSVEHRVVTNSNKARTSVSFFIIPTKDCLVEPAKALVTVENPPLYKAVRYQEFFTAFRAALQLKIGPVLKDFLINS